MKISVIVPVYNAEKYLRRCVDSIIAQTYIDWELIAINDGSVDNSLEILREYEKKDSRIKVIHQENAGAGVARNRGIECVSGFYTVFVDADDYIEPNYFELLRSHDEDVVFIDVNRCNQEGDLVKLEKMSINKHANKKEIVRAQMTGKIPWGGVRKAAKTSLFSNENIRYTKHTVGEEALFSFMLLHYSQTIGFIEESVYNYEVHSGSLSQTLVDDPWGMVVFVLRDKMNDLGIYEEYASTINAFLVTSTLVSLDKMAQIYEFKIYRKRAKDRVNILSKNIRKEYGIDYKSMDVKSCLMSPFVLHGAIDLVYFVSALRVLLRMRR